MFPRQLSAGGVDVFPFAAAYVDHHVTSFQKPDEGIPVFVRTVVKTRTFHIVVFDDIDLDRELAAIEGQSFCIFEAVVDIFQKQILEMFGRVPVFSTKYFRLPAISLKG